MAKLGINTVTKTNGKNIFLTQQASLVSQARFKILISQN